MIKIKIENEYSQLKTVILGIANDIGEAPSIFDTYDPRSLYHVKNNTFPNETSLVKNVESFYNNYSNIMSILSGQRTLLTVTKSSPEIWVL